MPAEALAKARHSKAQSRFLRSLNSARSNLGGEHEHPALREMMNAAVTAEYRINPADRAPFLAALHELARERRRDGAYAWRVFEDAATEGRMLETNRIVARTSAPAPAGNERRSFAAGCGPPVP
jgi:hypothetical protein